MVADTTVKYFASTMTGAPTLNNTAGSLIAVLDACLVNGFGLKTCDSVVISGGVGTATISTGHSAFESAVVLFSGATSQTALNGERKVTMIGTNTIQFDASDLVDGTIAGTITVKLAPAGWLKAFSATNQAAYKSGNVQASGMFVRVDDQTTTYASIRGYEVMTDINTVTGAFPNTTQQAHSSWPKANSAVAANWWVYANDRFVYFGVAPNASNPTNYFIYGFGDTVPRRSGDPYRFALFSNTADASGQSAGSAYSPVPLPSGGSCSRFLARSYTGLGSPVAVTLTWLGVNTFSAYAGISFPNPEDNAILFAPMVVVEGATYRGELPGILASPQAIGAGIVDGTRIKYTPGYGRTVMYRQAVHSAGVFGGVFFDLTGPWSN